VAEGELHRMSDAATIKRHDGRSQSQTRRFVQKLTFCGRLDRRRLGSRSQLGSIAVERLPEHLRRELRRLCPFRRNDYWRFFGLFVDRMLGANGCQHRFGPARRDWGTPSSPPLPLSLQIGTPWPDGIRKASCAHGVGTTVEVLDFLLTVAGVHQMMAKRHCVHFFLTEILTFPPAVASRRKRLSVQ
jgi:hypothetical protein